ncbi:GntR family transcriptional regulator [Acidiphilium iwatense]|uniref:GntR family transcriptional regulator n=1 Tax=Acidiphilium iwatense TaxID=768198 RepID=A0ABS9DYY4_9PROT|nr:GntR family transcriptional regulator [Acidiphilium iwatense]MCF3947974.1 GntR family transcriptional regulator [Acidiphilium iwatense]
MATRMISSSFISAVGEASLQKSGPQAEERVVNTVLEAILSNRVVPGERLIERELANTSGAGRMAIRNGLLRLAAAGLVEIHPNRGASIVRTSPDEMRQIFETRILIEEAALRGLPARLNDSGHEILEGILREESSAYEDGRIEDARHASRRFHIAIAELAGNTILAKLQRDLIHCQPLLASSRSGRASRFSGVSAHVETYAALVRGDGEEAARVNTALLKALQREMALDRHEEDSAERPEAPD